MANSKYIIIIILFVLDVLVLSQPSLNDYLKKGTFVLCFKNQIQQTPDYCSKLSYLPFHWLKVVSPFRFFPEIHGEETDDSILSLDRFYLIKIAVCRSTALNPKHLQLCVRYNLNKERQQPVETLSTSPVVFVRNFQEVYRLLGNETQKRAKTFSFYFHWKESNSAP